jgi:hypothetical protein
MRNRTGRFTLAAGLAVTFLHPAAALADKASTAAEAVELAAKADGTTGTVGAPPPSRSTPDSSIVVDLSGQQSWDVLNDPDNTTLLVPLGPGAIMTGIEWDVTITTIGGSWLSEAVSYFDGQDLDGTGLFLTPGVGDGFSGTGTYTSGGVVDLTDNAIADIPVGPDGLLYIQLHESFDDNANAPDATYDSPSTYTIYYIAGPAAVPTLGDTALILMALGLLLMGGIALRRRSRSTA